MSTLTGGVWWPTKAIPNQSETSTLYRMDFILHQLGLMHSPITGIPRLARSSIHFQQRSQYHLWSSSIQRLEGRTSCWWVGVIRRFCNMMWELANRSWVILNIWAPSIRSPSLTTPRNLWPQLMTRRYLYGSLECQWSSLILLNLKCKQSHLQQSIQVDNMWPCNRLTTWSPFMIPRLGSSDWIGRRSSKGISQLGMQSRQHSHQMANSWHLEITREEFSFGIGKTKPF